MSLVDGVVEAARLARARVEAGQEDGVAPCRKDRLPFVGFFRGWSGKERSQAFVGMSARREKFLAERRKKGS